MLDALRSPVVVRENGARRDVDGQVEATFSERYRHRRAHPPAEGNMLAVHVSRDADAGVFVPLLEERHALRPALRLLDTQHRMVALHRGGVAEAYPQQERSAAACHYRSAGR